MDWIIFVWGCFGAAAPEIIRLYKIRTKKPSLECPWFYVCISICFLLLGGIVAVILPTVTVWGAFYAGMALPTIISGVLNKPPQSPRLMDTSFDKNSCDILKSIDLRKFDIREYLSQLFL